MQASHGSLKVLEFLQYICQRKPIGCGLCEIAAILQLATCCVMYNNMN